MDNIKKLGKPFVFNETDDKLTNVMALIFANSKLSNEIKDGYFIAKQQFSIYGNSTLDYEKLNFKATIIKKKESNDSSYISCKVEVIIDEHLHSELYTSLMKRKSSIDQLSKSDEYFVSKNNKKLTSFSPEQITGFAQWSGDENSIHYGERPIVQGMFLLLTLEKYLDIIGIQLFKGDIRYLEPIRANEDIFIAHEKNKIIGIVNNIQCFVLKYEEDK